MATDNDITISRQRMGFELCARSGSLGQCAQREFKPAFAHLNREIVRALALPDATEKLAGLGFETGAMSPEEFGTFMHYQSETFGRVIREYKIRVE